MRRLDFKDFQTEIFKQCQVTTATKGNDYAGDIETDHFANFYRHADMLGITPELVWAVYTGKHWDAIMSFVREGKVESEPIEERIKDMIVYLTLLAGHIKTREQEAIERKHDRREKDIGGIPTSRMTYSGENTEGI